MNYKLVDFALNGEPILTETELTYSTILISRDIDSPWEGKFLQRDYPSFSVSRKLSIDEALASIKEVQAPEWVNKTYNK